MDFLLSHIYVIENVYGESYVTGHVLNLVLLIRYEVS